MNQQADRSINPDLEGFIKAFQLEGWTFIEAGDAEAEFERPALRVSAWWNLASPLDYIFLGTLGWLRGLHKAVDRLHIQVTEDGELVRARELVRMSDYDRAVELNPGDADAHYRRGISHHVLGQDELAIADFDRVVELDPNNTDGYYRRAIARADSGAVEEAIVDLQQALSVSEDPDDRAEIEELMEDLRPR